MLITIDTSTLEKVLTEQVSQLLGGEFQITEVDGNMRRYAQRLAAAISREYTVAAGTAIRRMNDWVNADVRLMAESLLEQAKQIGDEEASATVRRVKLHKAAAAIFLAYAELDGLSEVSPLR